MNEKIEKYVEGVLNGEIVAGRFVKQAVQRYLDDREHEAERAFHFDEGAANHAMRFIENFLFHSTGRWAGMPFLLEPWQAFIIWNIFGFKREDESRRFRIAHIEVGRKNGKSTLGAAVGVYCLLADREAMAEV